MLKNIKIFQKILFSCFFVTAIPLAGFIYQISVNGVEQKNIVEQNLLQSAKVIGGKIDSWVDTNLNNTSLLASMDAFKTMDAEAQVPMLKAAKENLEWVSLIFVKDLLGDAVARSDGKPLRNYSDREYFRQVIAGEKMGQQVLIGKVKPIPLHCFAIPIERIIGQAVGIITQCSSLASISDYVTTSKIGNSGYAFLVDSRKRLVAHGGERSKLLGKLQYVGEHPALKIAEDAVSIIEHEGKDRVFVTRSVGPDWTLVVQQDYDEAYESYLAAKINAIMLIVITVIITLLSSFLVSYNISSPIKALTKIADLISKNSFSGSVVGQDRKDEVGELAKAIARMSKTIDIAIRRLKKLG